MEEIFRNSNKLYEIGQKYKESLAIKVLLEFLAWQFNFTIKYN